MKKDWLRYRVPLGFLFGFGYIYLAPPPEASSLFLAVLLVALGCALRSWAAGYLLKGKRVAVGGPYAYVRNPLYLGSFILGCGFCAALWRSPADLRVLGFWGFFFLSFFVVYRSKSSREEAELAAALGAPYEQYREKVPALLPGRGRVVGLGNQRFSGALYRRNREYRCWLGSAAVLLILFLKRLHGF